MATIERAFEILKDGEWHSLDAIIKDLHLPKVKARKIFRFLLEFGFVVFDEGERKVRIDLEFQKFYEE